MSLLKHNLRFIIAVFAASLLSMAIVSCCCTGGLDDEDLPIAEPDLVPPVAVVSATPSEIIDSLDVDFDATQSYDTDGTIVQYDWDFDTDGTYDLLAGGATPTHTYAESGTYTATVRVTDNDGLTDTAPTSPFSIPINVTPPEAVGSSTPDPEQPLRASFDASESFDTDGTIEQYDWDMDNDGTFEIIDGGPNPDHVFASYGTHTVGVRVTDNDGLTDTTTIDVTLTEPVVPVPPLADLVPDPDGGEAPGLEVTWDASGSSDADGTIEQYDWDMDNDGTYEITDGGTSQLATYDAGGTVTVGVQVTDNDGLTGSTTATITVIQAPVADVIADPDHGDLPDLLVAFDASGSTDPDGTIEQVDWDMDNDGTYEITDGGMTQSLNYTTAGVHTVGIQVTDNDGLTDTATVDVDVNTPPNADLEGAIQEAEGEGKTVSFPTAGIEVLWDASSSTDPDGTIEQFDWDMDNDGIFEIIAGPATQLVTYSAYDTYIVGVQVTDDDGAMDTATAQISLEGDPPVADLTGGPGAGIYEVTWDASGSYDTDGIIGQYEWDIANDGTYDHIGLVPTYTYDYGTYGEVTCMVRVADDDALWDTATASFTILDPPTADLDGTVGWQTEMPYAPYVDWDASGSFDNDGTIVKYEWDIDDDGTYDHDTGNVPTHQEVYDYMQNGATCTVRVTDNDGLTDTATLTVPFSQMQYPPVAILYGEDIGDWTVRWDATTSFDSDGTIVLYEFDFDNDGTYDYSGTSDEEYHSYVGGGTVTCRLRVTDNDGLTDTATQSVELGSPE